MRNAVTVLVVVLMLVLATALTLSAIGRSREAAARQQCRHHLLQLGLALEGYRETYGHFPRAAEPNPSFPPQRRLSWLVSIGPFAEPTRRYVKMDRDKSWDAVENNYLALTALPFLRCPDDPNRPAPNSLVPTSYVGISGLGVHAAALPQEDPGAGFFGYDRQLVLSDVKDRTGTLLVAVETARVGGAWTAGGPPTVRGLEEDGPPYLGVKGQFGGLHPGGANALFADGSVRFLRESLDPQVLRAAATLRGSRGVELFGEE
jgi:prepilin-type processing-associated H-X9-DG protein